MPGVLRGRVRTAGLVLYAATLLAASVWTVAGGSLLILLVLVLPAALLVLRSRLPLSAALALLLVAFAWTTLVLFIISRYTRIPPIALVIAVAVLVGFLCALRVSRAGPAFTRADAVDLGFAGSGGVVWCGVLLLAALTTDGAPLSWAMSGDAANNILFVRTMLEQGGVSLGAGQNPVPLTSSFIALFTLPGAVGGPPAVGTQIVALAEMWTFGIIAACIMCGAFALTLVRDRTVLRYLVVAATSMLPLGWLLLSGPILLGFVNFHLTIALLLAALVALMRAQRHVLTSFVTIALALGAILALWAPLAGIPGVALVVVAVVHRRALLAMRKGRLVVALVALAQPVALFFALSLPSLLAQGGALQDSLGAVYEFRKSHVAILLVVALVAGWFHMRVTRSAGVGWVLFAVVVGGGSCLALLLWIRRNEANLWMYYQLKFVWFFLAMVLIVAVAAGLAAAAVIRRRAALSALSAVSLLVVVAGVGAVAQATVPTFSGDSQALKNPLARILTGDFFSVGEGDRVFDRVVEIMDADEKTMLWNSTDPDEDSIMFWVVQMSSTGVEDEELRTYAYYHDPGSMDDLCTIRELMGEPVTVVTADPEIVSAVAASCPELGPVRLEQ